MLPCPQHQAQWWQWLPFAHVHHCHYPPSSRLFKLDSERDKTNKNVRKSRNDSLFQMFIPYHSFIQFPFSENTTQRASSHTSIILHKSNKTLSHFSGTQHPGPKLAWFRRHPNQTPRERFHGTTHVFPLRPLFQVLGQSCSSIYEVLLWPFPIFCRGCGQRSYPGDQTNASCPTRCQVKTVTQTHAEFYKSHGYHAKATYHNTMCSRLNLYARTPLAPI